MMYFDLEKQERDAAIGYLLSSILHARKTCGIPSNEKTFDEDVNIYLAHLLFAFLLPDYQQLIGRYLSLNATDLMDAVEKQEDKVVRYFIYKVNADYLLVHLGIFNDLTTAHPRHFQKSEKQFIELGQTYYDHASQYNHHIYRKHTAVGDVLEKLSSHFEDYRKILHAMREEFFHLAKRMESEGAGRYGLPKVVKRIELEHRQNEFLDVYGEWLRTKSRDLAMKLVHLAGEIRKLDPAFGFNSDSLGGLENGGK